jgi:hypothetical protein
VFLFAVLRDRFKKTGEKSIQNPEVRITGVDAAHLEIDTPEFYHERRVQVQGCLLKSFEELIQRQFGLVGRPGLNESGGPVALVRE